VGRFRQEADPFEEEEAGSLPPGARLQAAEAADGGGVAVGDEGCWVMTSVFQSVRSHFRLPGDRYSSFLPVT
jgi:hypothetical protein